MMICPWMALCCDIGLRPNSFNLCVLADYKDMIQSISDRKYNQVFLIENSTCIKFVSTMNSMVNPCGIYSRKTKWVLLTKKVSPLFSGDGRVLINTE